MQNRDEPAPTGFPDLDRMHGGVRPGELLVIGGRPGTGRSRLFPVQDLPTAAVINPEDAPRAA